MSFKTSFTLFATTTLLSAMVLAADQIADAICKVDVKTIKIADVKSPAQSFVDQLKRINTLSLFGHRNLWSGSTVIEDDVELKFIDINSRVVVQDLSESSKAVSHEMVQSTGLYDKKNILMTKQAEISGDVFTARYTHVSKITEPVKMTMTVGEKIQTDHILRRGAVVTLESKDGSVSAKLNCKDSFGERFTK